MTKRQSRSVCKFIITRHIIADNKIVEHWLCGWDMLGCPLFKPFVASHDGEGIESSYNMPIVFDSYEDADIATDHAGEGSIEACGIDWVDYITEQAVKYPAN